MPQDYSNKERLTKMFLFYLLLVLVVGGCIIYGIIKIQWIDGDEWRKRGEVHEEGYRPDPAARGDIYSSDGKILATTIPVCDLYLDLGHQPKRDNENRFVRDSNGNQVMESPIHDTSYNNGLNQVCKLLHQAVPSKSIDYFKTRIETERHKANPHRCFPVQKGIPYSIWREICKIQGWNKGVVKQVTELDNKGKPYTRNVIRNIRAHIYGNLGENAIGFYNGAIENTFTGLEGYYDSILRGSDGIYYCRRLTRGTWIPKDNGIIAADPDAVTLDSTSLKSKVDGKAIISTLDTRYQDVAESALREMLLKCGGEGGCAILMEMETGHVMACANLTRDTNGSYWEMPNSNLAYTRIYEPGSTFKTVIMTAMLNDKTANIDTAERVHIGGKKAFSASSGVIADDFGNNRDTSTLRGILAHSSNIGMCELGWKYFRNRRKDLKEGVMHIYPYESVVTDLRQGKAMKGRVNNLDNDRDFLNFCYGYSCNTTAMQLLTFYNALGNGGRMVKPIFCKGYIENGELVPFGSVVLNESICSPETAKQMKDLLVNVVENGTGNNIKNNTYGIAGKTGTAFFYEKGGYHSDIFNASFAGFFPAESPKYSCIVVIFRVPYRHGREAAAPVFKKIADCVVAMDKKMDCVKVKPKENCVKTPIFTKGDQQQVMKIHQLLGYRYPSADSNAHWVMQDSTGHHAYKPANGFVPDCKGMTIKDAMELLNQCGLRVKFSGYGKVTSQNPRAGSACKKGATVVLTLK